MTAYGALEKWLKSQGEDLSGLKKRVQATQRGIGELQELLDHGKIQESQKRIQEKMGPQMCDNSGQKIKLLEEGYRKVIQEYERQIQIRKKQHASNIHRSKEKIKDKGDKIQKQIMKVQNDFLCKREDYTKFKGQNIFFVQKKIEKTKKAVAQQGKKCLELLDDWERNLQMRILEEENFRSSQYSQLYNMLENLFESVLKLR